MTKIQSPKFEGKPIVEFPKEIPIANFLVDDFGRAMSKEYSARVKAEYNDNKNLNVLSCENNIVVGSNSFSQVLVNDLEIIKGEGLRTATQADLERILRTSALTLSGIYVDSGLVLRSEGEPNVYLARNLAIQIKERGIKKVGKVPLVVMLKDLGLTNDQNSQYGLSFKLKDNAEIIEASILTNDGIYSSDNIDVKTGIPTEYGDGKRNSCTATNGLRRLYLSRVSLLSSTVGRLAGSVRGGRVVVVRGEAARADVLNNMIEKLQASRDEQIAVL